MREATTRRARQSLRYSLSWYKYRIVKNISITFGTWLEAQLEIFCTLVGLYLLLWLIIEETCQAVDMTIANNIPTVLWNKWPTYLNLNPKKISQPFDPKGQHFVCLVKCVILIALIDWKGYIPTLRLLIVVLSGPYELDRLITTVVKIIIIFHIFIYLFFNSIWLMTNSTIGLTSNWDKKKEKKSFDENWG